jgi:outer membrane protein OmpA-like peptidoglycan-associated protein
MNVNLLSLAQSALGGDFARQASQLVGESQGTTQSALTTLLPAVIGAIAQKGSTPEGASGLMSLINGSNLDTSVIGNIGSLFGGGGTGASDLLKAGTSRLVPALFGDKAGPLVNTLSSMSGMKTSSATNLLALIVPMVLALLKKLVGERGLSASGLSSLLSGQAANLEGTIDSRLTSALGFASPSSFLSGLGGATADAARRAAGAVGSGAAAAGSAAYGAGSAAYSMGSTAAEAARPAFMRWLPWIIGAAILLLLWWMFAGRTTEPTSTVTPAPTATAPASTTAPTASTATPTFAGFPAKVYFATGSATLAADAGSVIAAVADEAKKGNVKLAITGYTDKTGDTAKNEELAKSRAQAVRDALKGAGVAESNLEMRPPMFVEAGAAAASDAEARRVEINRM